ncbi:MAG: UPF0280 family protein [Methanomicrobiales archaeon]|nr:UPF0280 family protein [Methanomicrobiales archaeon]
MIRRHFQYKETIATILADTEDHITAAIQGMLAARMEIERCIARDPFFSITYYPYTPDDRSLTVLRMSDAATRAQVGPMAAVAGTIAWAGVEAMEKEGALFGVIDNGGDIALMSDRTIRVGVHAGTAPSSNRRAFLVPPTERILGICTSSATVGPSVSFGTADAVTVFSCDTAAADAWATAICNQVSADDDSIFQRITDPSILGVFVISGAFERSWGDLPPLVHAQVDSDLITREKAIPQDNNEQHGMRLSL